MQDIISRLRAKKDEEGFTLIELLVVVVIIGVLVAIAVPVYLNYREGAADKSAQSDVRGAISAVEQYYTNNSNKYPADVTATTGTSGKIDLAAQTNGTAGTITLSSGTTLALKNNTSYYVICATNQGGTKDKVYVYNSQAGGSVKASGSTTVAACITAGN
ncbi:prepilin-type N-terminal cleavage/methylation domain-containing protein [Actinoplanes sp. NPDC051633]|jgi:type IV pilus assembly protein PilA|uniref:prepilin-type N-terminal cleavage/methylation domain-containing protein n=1 Tax=Actinoplanes sp. NPDC051633 TaxID=3155670 RepID=UPI00341B0305